MLECGHAREASGDPLCRHLCTCREPWLSYVRWYTGSGLEADLLCIPCAEDRAKGTDVVTGLVCEECFAHITTEVGELSGIRGTPGVRTRPERFDATLKRTPLPAKAGAIVDIAPICEPGSSMWLMLTKGGALIRFNAETGEWVRVTSTSVPSEWRHKPWNGRTLRRTLHASPCGGFAAVVNDYGRYGQIIDLRRGKVTLKLDGGNYHAETVRFSFAFAQVGGKTVAIHRTDWNRLDISDPGTGKLLTGRTPTSYGRGSQRPEHYLDYFHGALQVSPGNNQIYDDGWVWHPVGIPVVWNLEQWAHTNVWESDDGPTKQNVCARDYYWGGAACWIDESRIVVGGIGVDDDAMVDGARVFDTALPGTPGPQWRADVRWAREVASFAGPAGAFFSDGTRLFSADAMGLSRWDVADGSRTGHLADFHPTHHHRQANELVELSDGVLIRLAISQD